MESFLKQSLLESSSPTREVRQYNDSSDPIELHLGGVTATYDGGEWLTEESKELADRLSESEEHIRTLEGENRLLKLKLSMALDL
ncbi:hypothetical protein HDU93_004204, partial [Gonapodya sp. JEL0774]